MEDIVGIKIKDKYLGEVAFVTWGRVCDRTDPEPLFKAIKKNLSKFGITELVSISICETLQEVSSFPYFYEALFVFAQQKQIDDANYAAWRIKKKKAIEQGEEIYFLGLSRNKKLKVFLVQ